MEHAKFADLLPSDLQARLMMIIQTAPSFWEMRHYAHFIKCGPVQSERVYRQLAQLAQELPEELRLNSDEVFVASAAAWLYEIGMQSPQVAAPGELLSVTQLQEIRDKKYLLTEQLILDSIRSDYQGPPIPLGMISPMDDYTRTIADVCRWCSNEPLQDVPKEAFVNGIPVRVRLLVALLRLADQLYIDNSRIDLDLLQRAELPMKELARWWTYHYAQVLPIQNGQIRFYYFLPANQKEYLGYIRALLEPEFRLDTNPTLYYLGEEFHLRLMLNRNPMVRFDQTRHFQREMSREITTYLRSEVPPLEVRTVTEPPTPVRPGPDQELQNRHSNTRAATRIFLSYARQDAEKVKDLYRRLFGAGFTPWMDTEDILPGENWKNSIQRAIRKSDFFLACLSANSINKRGFLQTEIKEALDVWREKLEDDIYLIPVRLEECETPESLSDFQRVNLYEENSWSLLVKAIQVGMKRRTRGSGPAAAKPFLEEGQAKFPRGDKGRGKMIKILFLAANPSDTTRLRLDEESRAIDQALRQAEFRDSFDIKQHFAVRVADLQSFLLRHKPDIVHFSGHGSESSEIVLEDSSGHSQPVSARALSTLFSVLKDNIKCVVLNACYSEPQAQAIAEHIDCVVGMSESIGDRAAVSFAASFYQALGFGRDVKTAFDLGCVQIDLESLDEQDIPKLISKKCDPKEVFFVSGV